MSSNLKSATDSPLRGYSIEEFYERYDTVIELTSGYDGALESVWEDAQNGVILNGVDRKNSPPPLKTGSKEMHQIVSVAQRLHNAGVTKAVIEAAHVYIDDDLSSQPLRDDLYRQSVYASHLTTVLNAIGIDTTNILFVDDYNVDSSRTEVSKKFDLDELLDITRTGGYSPNLVMREGSMVDLAKNMIKIMDVEQGLVIQSDKSDDTPPHPSSGFEYSSDLFLSRRNHELYRARDEKVSCAMLDAALTVVKFRFLGQGVINVLPNRPENQQFSYRGQQQKMRTIVGEHLGARVLPVCNLFTGTDFSEPVRGGSHHYLRKPRR